MAEQVAIKGIQLLHKRYTTEAWGSHTLQAGELGLDLSTFEVRIGTAANQAWANAAPVGIKSIVKNTENGTDYLKDVSFDVKTGTMTLVYEKFSFADDTAVQNLQKDLDALEEVVGGEDGEGGLVGSVNTLSTDLSAVQLDITSIHGTDAGSSMREVAESVRDAYNTATVQPIAERVGVVEGAVATKVEAETYNAKVEELEDAINAKVATETYNAKVQELEGDINSKVATETYNTKVQELEGDINSKVAQSAYDTKVAELQDAIDAKVAQSAYDTKVKALDDEDDRLEGLINTEKGRIDGIVADYETATHAAQTYETIAEANKVRGRVETLEKAGYLTAADKTELQNNINGVSGKVTTLIGDDANKSVRTIANEELAKQLVAEGAAESLDTLAEIAAWIQSHPDDAAAMNKAIDDLEALVGTLPAGITATTVTGYVTEVKNAVEAEIARLDAEKQDVITETSGVSGVKTVSLPEGEDFDNYFELNDDYQHIISTDVIKPSDIVSLSISGSGDYEVDEGYSTGYFDLTLDDASIDGNELSLYVQENGFMVTDLYIRLTDNGILVDWEGNPTIETFEITYNTSVAGMVVKKEHLPSDIVYQEALNNAIGNLNNNYYTKGEVDSALNDKATVSSVNTVAADLDKVEAKLVNVEETVVKSIEAAVAVEKGRAEGAEGQLASRIKAIEDKGLENGSVYAKQADLEATDAIADAAKAQADTNKAAIDVLNGTTADSVSGKINAAITGLNISQYATTGALAEVSNVANAADTLSKANAGKIATLEAVTYEGDGKVTLAKEGNVVKAAHAATFAEAQTEGFYTFSFDKYGHITGVKAITVLDGNA